MPKLDLSDKEANIVIIDHSGTIKPTLSAVLRKFGYRNLLAFKSIKEFMRYDGRHETAWLLSHSYIKEELSAFHLLKSVLEDPKFPQMKISVFFAQGEDELVPFAYALGAFSHEIGSLTAQALEVSAQRIIQLISLETKDFAISSTFLRTTLTDAALYEDRVQLEETLLESTDQSCAQILNTAEACFLNQEKSRGVAYLYEAILFQPQAEAQANALSIKHTQQPLREHSDPIERNTCVVVDPDAAARNAICDILQTIDFLDIMEFEDAKEALDFVRKNPKIDLIISEWKLVGMTGPAFVQVIRHEITSEIPIILCSSLLKEKDGLLLREIGVNRVTKKPIQSKAMSQAILNTLKESQYPSTSSAREREFRLKIRAGKLDDAMDLLQLILKDSKVSPGKKALLKGEMALQEEDFQEAKRLGLQSAEISGANTFVLNLIGKACMKLGDHESALKYLEKANSLSPENLERLCTIATEKSKLGRSEEAQADINKIEAAAPGSAMARETQVAAAINDHHLDEANELLGKMDENSSLVVFWNNKAITFVKQGNFMEGIKVYRQALQSLPPGYSDNRSFIRYNLALAYARHNKLKRAIIYLESEKAMVHSPVHKKVVSLLSKSVHALRTGTAIEFNSAEPVEMKEQKKSRVRSETFQGLESHIPPGERCLWGIYYPTQPIPLDLSKVLSNDDIEKSA